MSTNNPLEFFNFLSLPVELRVECYKHIARDSKRLTFYDWGYQSSTYMRLLKTCHQIRDEAASYQPEIIELMVTKPHRILADLTAAPKSILDQIEIFSIDMTNSARHLSHEDDYGRILEALPNLKEARVYNMLVEDLAFENTGLTALAIPDDVIVSEVRSSCCITVQYIWARGDAPPVHGWREWGEGFDREFTTTVHVRVVGLGSCQICHRGSAYLVSRPESRRSRAAANASFRTPRSSSRFSVAKSLLVGLQAVRIAARRESNHE